MSAKDTWTPYGLEAIRVSYLRRRRLYAIMIGLGLCGIWAFMFETTTETQTDIFVNGRRQGSGIEIDIPEQNREDGPVTVAVEPGRVTRAASGEAPEGSTPTRRVSAPTFERGSPIPYQIYVILYGPYLLLAAALYFLAKKRGKHDQVNFGIYKGAMPLESISASLANQIFTSKKAKTGLFGKRRADHLPEEILQVERVPQDGEA
jgi:hypothetical protein